MQGSTPLPMFARPGLTYSTFNYKKYSKLTKPILLSYLEKHTLITHTHTPRPSVSTTDPLQLQPETQRAGETQTPVLSLPACSQPLASWASSVPQQEGLSAQVCNLSTPPNHPLSRPSDGHLRPSSAHSSGLLFPWEDDSEKRPAQDLEIPWGFFFFFN